MVDDEEVPLDSDGDKWEYHDYDEDLMEDEEDPKWEKWLKKNDGGEV